MNNIETMKLALEALEFNVGEIGFTEVEKKALKALRQAIENAHQAEPFGASEETQRFAIQIEKLLCEKLGRKWSPSGISIQTLVDELADRQTQQAEPFGYFQFDLRLDAWVQNRHTNKGVAFYTSPLSRQPLTDEEIYKASTQAKMQEHYMGFHSGFIRFARAIEAAHGIKGEA